MERKVCAADGGEDGGGGRCGREGETAGAAHRRQARKESGRSGKAAGRYILFC